MMFETSVSLVTFINNPGTTPDGEKMVRMKIGYGVPKSESGWHGFWRKSGDLLSIAVHHRGAASRSLAYMTLKPFFNDSPGGVRWYWMERDIFIHEAEWF